MLFYNVDSYLHDFLRVSQRCLLYWSAIGFDQIRSLFHTQSGQTSWERILAAKDGTNKTLFSSQYDESHECNT